MTTAGSGEGRRPGVSFVFDRRAPSPLPTHRRPRHPVRNRDQERKRMSNDKHQPGPSRRQFLVGLGVTGAGLVATGAGPAPVLAGLASAAAEPRFEPGPGTPDNAHLFG